MSRARIAALFAAFLVCLCPAAALAQSAGDQQYEDPFAGDTGSGGGGSAPAQPPPTLEDQIPDAGSPSTSPGSASPGGGSATTGGEASGRSSGASAPAAAAAPAAGSLPATGGEATLLALLGGGLVLAGSGLRLRLHGG